MADTMGSMKSPQGHVYEEASTETSQEHTYEEIPTTNGSARRKGIHWHIPALMLGAILAGGLLALGHDFFYQSLDGRPASEGMFLGTSIPQQQANIAIATAMAFAVKVCLVFAIGIAFIQIFWCASQPFETSKTPLLGWLDSAYGARQSFRAFLHPALWRRYPLLLAVASIAWITPIASILTPSTLSVRSAAIMPPPAPLVHVPNIDFRSMSFLAPMQQKGRCYTYSGPDPAVSRVANAVMALGEILPFKAPYSNASWVVEFAGPSLRCDHVTGKTFNTIRHNIHGTEYDNFIYYASWFPGGQGNRSNLLPFQNPKTLHPIFSTGSLAPSNNADLAFLMAAMPVLGGKQTLNMTPAESVDAKAEIRNFTLVQCRLLNSTYKVSFNFTNGDPTISALTTPLNKGLTVQSIETSCTNTTTPTVAGYTLPGVILKDHCSASDRTCVYHPEFFQTLSYQAVLDAFSDQIVGQISGLRAADANADTDLTMTSNILNTAIAETPDLIKLVPGQLRSSDIWSTSLQHLLHQLDPKSTVLMREPVNIMALDLPQAVEQLFQNVTVSLLTSAALQPNSSSPAAPGPVQVTLHKYHNVYAYSPRKLWIPYCVAIILTSVTALVGLYTIVSSDATYKDNFSTVFRAARGANPSAEVRGEDVDGRYPLPKYLKSARVRLPGSAKTVKTSPFARNRGFKSLNPPPDDTSSRTRWAVD